MEAWVNAYDFHVYSFHEHAYTVEDMESRVEVVERLVTYTMSRLEQQNHRARA
ncbi:MAG TPA: hypothetical protein EYH59_03350 [Pyrodictium sp.]|nr:hypothetical protein [Pyrodictium sp.]